MVTILSEPQFENITIKIENSLNFFNRMGKTSHNLQNKTEIVKHISKYLGCDTIFIQIDSYQKHFFCFWWYIFAVPVGPLQYDYDHMWIYSVMF